jgi:hypothetical protein
MKIKKLTPKKLLLEFISRKEMTLSNFRISEFKEGKDGIKGTYFTVEKFIEIYSDEKGDIDYFSYWEGFNYSKKELMDFDNLFNDKSERELSIILASKEIDDDGYIICMEEGDEMTLKHELSHGYFFENEKYKEECTSIVKSITEDTFNQFRDYLYEMDYNDDNMIDEMHAYLVAYDEEEWDECFNLLKDNEEILSVSKSLNILFNEVNNK